MSNQSSGICVCNMNDFELNEVREIVSKMTGRGVEEVRVVASPYLICPLGAHIDHQGGTVSAMTINKGIVLGFIPSGDSQVVLRSGQFKGEVRFSIDEVQHPRHDVNLINKSEANGSLKPVEECSWGNYARGALYALQRKGNTLFQVVLRSGQFKGEVRFSIDEVQHPRHDVNLINKSEANGSLKPVEECSWGNYARGALYALQRKGNTLFQGITGYICGSEGLDSSGLSSSAAVGEKLETCQGTIVKNFIFFVGVAYLLAFETANNLTVSPVENIEYDRLIENDYLGLRNGILDQSAILLSSYGCLLIMNCKTLEHKLVHPPELRKAYKILLAFSGLKHALTQNPGYNCRVSECREAARILLSASGMGKEDAVLSDVEPREYQEHKSKLEPNLAKRAEHYFTETLRVNKGIEAWASGNLEDFGMLITASGLSSIQNYECGSEPLILLYKILVKTPGIFGVRFSGAGFRGCCIALVDANFADEAASSVRREYQKLQPELAYQLNHDTAVLICDTGDCARVI